MRFGKVHRTDSEIFNVIVEAASQQVSMAAITRQSRGVVYAFLSAAKTASRDDTAINVFVLAHFFCFFF